MFHPLDTKNSGFFAQFKSFWSFFLPRHGNDAIEISELRWRGSMPTGLLRPAGRFFFPPEDTRWGSGGKALPETLGRAAHRQNRRAGITSERGLMANPPPPNHRGGSKRGLINFSANSKPPPGPRTQDYQIPRCCHGNCLMFLSSTVAFRH